METIKGCSVIDLFCGVGGLTHGFVQEGFKVLAGVDCDSSCKFAYETNNSGAVFIDSDIALLNPIDIRRIYPRSHTKILVGCAPCQPFSSYNKRRRDRNDKWKLLETFADLVEGVRPHIVSMENVPDLVRFDGGKVYKNFTQRLRVAGYHVTQYIVHCPDYGVPQKRDRLVLFASKFGSVDLVKPTHDKEEHVSVREVIGNLPRIAAGEMCLNDRMHIANNLAPINLQRIKHSKAGGTWRDWPEELRADCHKKASGDSYDAVYGRMHWDKPAPTITTQCNGYGNGRFGHPEQDRAISMREAAILQSFPNEYQFLDPDKNWHVETLARLIGNAVPVKLGQAIARSIRAHIER